MEAKDLRIGNWVIEFHKRIQINMIDGVGVCGTVDGGMLEIKDLNPIPLTEEILLKCGFVYNGYKYDCDDGVERRVFEHKDYFGDFIEYDGYYLPKPYYFEDAFGENFKLKHLHQLQNLYFALTGEELNVEL